MLRESNNDVFYIFAARPTPWDVESSPPAVDDSIFAFDNEIFRNIVFGKQITESDTAPAVRRINWTSNTVFDYYDATEITDTSNTQYYVLTSDKKVFKCIDNNDGAVSLIEPFLDSTRTFKTSDGYSWRYLYTISDADFSKFATTNYIPVTPNTQITAAAIPGTIDFISVVNTGSAYTTYNTGNVVTVINNTTFIVEPAASANDGFYVDSAIYFDGDLISDISTIVGYDGDTKTVTVDPPINLKLEVILQAGSGTFESNTEVEQEYYTAVTSNTSGPAVVPTLDIIQRGSGGANQLYVVIDSSENGFRFHRLSANDTVSLTEPWRSAAGDSLKTGLATTSVGSNVVTGTSGSLFNTEYIVGEYLRVGTEVRQIATITSASNMTTYQTWSTAYSANSHIKPARAGFFSSATQNLANGIVDSVDMSAATIYLGTVDGEFVSGEEVYQANSSGTVATGLIIDANSSTLFVGNVTGSFSYTSNLEVVGANSAATGLPRANNGVVVTPRLLISNAQGTWYIANVSNYNSLGTEIANSKISTIDSFPGVGTSYVIGPRVLIDGDGSNAAAFCVVNSVTQFIESVTVVNPGQDYTFANVSVVANSAHGNGAALKALLSPVDGVGANVQNELGAIHTSISVQMQNSVNEGYYFSTNSTFRQIGILKNPKFRDISLSIGTPLRATVNISSIVGAFTVGEIVYQSQTAAAAVITSANSTVIGVKEISGTFIANTANDNIRGLASNTTANVRIFSFNSFPVNTAITQTIYQDSTEANAVLLLSNSSTLVVTNAVGVYTNTSSTSNTAKARGENGYVYDTYSNSYAAVTDIKNDRKANNFTFSKFNQIMRVPVDSMTGSFTNNELVTQGTATGFVLNSDNDYDLSLTGITGTFAIGDVVQQATTNATAHVIFANSFYLKVTHANGAFQNGFAVAAIGGGSGANATGSTAYRVLNIYGSDSDFATVVDPIVGAGSNAQATSLTGESWNPDLVRNTGEVLYIQNSTAVLKTAPSQEQIKLVVQYL